MTADKSVLRKEVAKDGGLADAVIQLDASLGEIKSGKATVSKRNVIQGLIVVGREIVLLNAPPTREIIDEVVFEKLGRAPRVRYQFCNDFGFEHLARYLANGASLGRFLYEKLRSEEKASWDIHLALPDEDLGPHPLRGEPRALSKLLARYNYQASSSVPPLPPKDDDSGT